MIWLANVLIAIIAVLHVGFLVLEMFLWTKPLWLKTFHNTPEKAQDSAVLAANQGLYNGFLAAGLIWGLVQAVPAFAFQIKVFFLLCVIVGGAYGAATVSRRIMYVQAAPAVLALIANVVAHGLKAGIEVSLCGDAASDPALVPHLLRCGLRKLSAAPATVGRVKAAIAGIDLGT